MNFAKSFDRPIGNGNLGRAIESALSVYESQLSRQSITFDVHLPPQVSSIKGNQGDLISVFLNLFSNSIDAMSDGGSLSVRARETGRTILVDVEDSGHGISTHLLDKVCEPWVSTKKTGSGVGLSICRHIMWDIGGEMNIQSTEGKGTNVNLRLPIEQAAIEMS